MPIPQYQAIRAGLEERIVSGELVPGARLPTESELQSEHGVSRATAQKALNELAQAGLVVRQRRNGTHVAEGARQVNLLRSVDPNLGSAGIPGRMSAISADVIPASKAEVDLPGIDGSTPVTQLVRQRYDREEKPIVVEVAAIPFALAPELLEENLEDLAVRAYFASSGVSIARSRMYFDPILLEDRHAQLLAMEPGVAVLRRRRLMWQPNGEIAESAAYYLRPGTIDFYIEYTNP